MGVPISIVLVILAAVTGWSVTWLLVAPAATVVAWVVVRDARGWIRAHFDRP